MSSSAGELVERLGPGPTSLLLHLQVGQARWAPPAWFDVLELHGLAARSQVVPGGIAPSDAVPARLTVWSIGVLAELADDERFEAWAGWGRLAIALWRLGRCRIVDAETFTEDLPAETQPGVPA